MWDWDQFWSQIIIWEQLDLCIVVFFKHLLSDESREQLRHFSYDHFQSSFKLNEMDVAEEVLKSISMNARQRTSQVTLLPVLKSLKNPHQTPSSL